MILHVDPDDNPTPNQPTTFYLEFNDPSKTFSLNGCECEVKINKGNEAIFRKTLDQKETQATFVSTLPEKGEYTVTVSGKPKPSGNFAPFELKHSLVVSRDPVANKNSWAQNPIVAHGLHLGLTVVAFLVFFALDARERKRKKQAEIAE